MFPKQLTQLWSGTLLLLTLIAGNLYAQRVRDSVTTLKPDITFGSLGALGGLAVDQLGYIYMANFARDVWQIAPDLSVKLLTNAAYGSSGITIDRHGDLYHGNFYGQSISKITRDGRISTYADTGLSGPVGLAMDSEDNLYVCNCSDNSISKITPARKVISFARSELFNCPNGITFGEKGDLYVVNFQNDHVVKITPGGKATLFATVPGGEGNAHIAYLKNSLYVTKIKTNSLFRVFPDGTSRPIVGHGLPGFADGAADSATLSRPNGIAADPVKSLLYVNNLVGEWNTKQLTNVLIRRITPATLTRTFHANLSAHGIDSAIAACREYIEENRFEDVGVELGTLGWAMMIRRDIASALAVFTLQRDTYPGRWRPTFYLCEVYKLLGQNDKAAGYYRQALKLDPTNAAIKEKLSQVESK